MSQAAEPGDYYRQFLQALFEGHTSATQVRLLMQQPAFAVYRNTVLKGCLDALAANYPVVCKLVGQDWFDGAAMAFARAHLPDAACLIDYGREFPAFLASFTPAQDLPYLAGVAALDRCWSESHLAADGPVLDATDLLAALSAGRDVRLVLHPATRWHWDEACPSYTIWAANRHPDTPAELAPEWQGEGALLTRPHDHVIWRAASAGSGVFLQACSDGASVAEAIGLALQREPALEMTAMLGELLLAGAFAGFE